MDYPYEVPTNWEWVKQASLKNQIVRLDKIF